MIQESTAATGITHTTQTTGTTDTYYRVEIDQLRMLQESTAAIGITPANWLQELHGYQLWNQLHQLQYTCYRTAQQLQELPHKLQDINTDTTDNGTTPPIIHATGKHRNYWNYTNYRNYTYYRVDPKSVIHNYTCHRTAQQLQDYTYYR